MEVVSALLTNAGVVGLGAAAWKILELVAGIYFGRKAITTDGERAERAHELARVLMSRRARRTRKK